MNTVRIYTHDIIYNVIYKRICKNRVIHQLKHLFKNLHYVMTSLK